MVNTLVHMWTSEYICGWTQLPQVVGEVVPVDFIKAYEREEV